jgi:GxxExxY protein
MRLNDVTEQIIGAAIDVHRELGPGLLESTSEADLQFELVGRGLRVERQKGLPVVHHDVRIDCGDRIDLLVEHRIIVALKAVAQLEPIHEAQSLSCLRLSGCHVGLSINFNGKLLRNGIRRLVNEFKE